MSKASPAENFSMELILRWENAYGREEATLERLLLAPGHVVHLHLQNMPLDELNVIAHRLSEIFPSNQVLLTVGESNIVVWASSRELAESLGLNSGQSE